MGWQDAPVVNDSHFRAWYAFHAKKQGLSPDPDDPQHFYDYRAAHKAGAKPDRSGHWPSEFKREGHPNLVIDGVDTRTGEPAKAAWESAPIVEDAPDEQPAPAGEPGAGWSGQNYINAGKGLVGGLAKSAYNTLAGATQVLAPAAEKVGLGKQFPPLKSAPVDPDEEAAFRLGNVAQFMTPGGPVRGAAGMLAQGAKAYAVDRAQGGTGTVAGAMGAAGPAVAKVAEVAAPGLRKLAETQYARALNATTKANKAESAKVVPEMLDQRVRGSLERLAEKGTAGSERAGQELGKAYEAATNAGVTTSTAPILKSLEKMKQRFFVTGAGGKAINSNPGAVSKIEEVEGLIRQFGADASPGQLWKFRKNLDDIISAGGGFGVQLTPGTTKALQREARLAIQKELNKASPDIETLNATFSLWKGLEKVTKATIERQRGQSGVVEAGIRSGLGGLGGLLLGGDDPQWAAVGALMGMVTKSPRYRTVAAVEKARLAHALSQSQTAKAISILSRLAAGLGATSGQSFGDPAGSPTQ
jgi:hypothetical protein